ncbi:MAG: hypothetical protein VB024_02180 [Dysgonamonadaceae bacterium]|mgnify:CR=1 FL=1|jgi:hypothetical protein|nr:hypothetical protein [Dysgonamonadaceae bacterium]MEA5080411.1 hypothetical protein [Dysgonamonadaceae bacterium]
MKNLIMLISILSLLFGISGCKSNAEKGKKSELSLDTKNLTLIREVDPRYQSYNIEMVEVVGGKFWRPYNTLSEVDTTNVKNEYGIDISSGNEALYRKMEPINLTEPKLLTLVRGLAPAYVRCSGTWANAVYFQNDDKEARPAPKGFVNVLTGKQWFGLLDFIKTTDGKLVTSFAVSDGVRDKNGVWTPVEAQKLIDFSKKNGLEIAAAELFNEPTMPQAGGAFSNTKYDANAYARDIAAFEVWQKKEAPYMLHVGPGTVGEGVPGFMKMLSSTMNTITTADIMSATPTPHFDVFSYHFYGSASKRVVKEKPLATFKEDALTPQWITLTDSAFLFFDDIHNKYTPDAPIWITETAQAAGGGDPWANTYYDVFRYLYQMGSLAQKGVDVIFHNTLVASEYSLIDQDTHIPNPNYWMALLWNRLMGTQVYNASSSSEGVYLFAHNTKDDDSKITFLVINISNENKIITAPEGVEVYALTAENLDSREVMLNGTKLALTTNNELPETKGVAAENGQITIAPQSIAYITVPKL